MVRDEPHPVTTTHELLAQVRDELRTLNERLGDAQPSGPAVADGVSITERPVGDEPPQPCEAVTAKGKPCGRMPPCRYHDGG